ncbi:F0F1 ATP synthase subunit alpha [Pusillimonas sp. ANT_WB101]|uniref:F0F1 ATP synthase subunit alpha n=1 Tax=Pusillimonas sp. ANT_WB101 TaxID=2597356 RepID=UPI0011EF9C22|nr:F0F1 ATP synthase subunit alpha [Pusillimonas sp. ANT_WB101]KAA0892789.1 F0F1 ATP synthase subunit alpha [Pusillimonas sp. ANT_WB101]
MQPNDSSLPASPKVSATKNPTAGSAIDPVADPVVDPIPDPVPGPIPDLTPGKNSGSVTSSIDDSITDPIACLIETLVQAPTPPLRIEEVGRVTQVGAGIATVTGLARAVSDEMLEFSGGMRGLVLDLEPGRLGVALLGPYVGVRVGEEVRRTHKVVSVPVGKALLGRVVNALGSALDGGAPIFGPTRPVEARAAPILDRAPVTRPLATGLKVVDAAVPVGLGQRELIIGDRQTGKTSMAVDTILHQKDSDVICIYCAVGQRGDAVAKVVGALKEGGMQDRSVVVVSGDEDAPGLSFIAPYAAMSIAESFSDKGHDVLVVLDDMTHHARAYRELSLLLRRPPGREAFPGDIFYVHARLLERAGQFANHAGGGSITALPIVETQAENLSAYIPTNLISITDGQIYLSPRLVRRNQFPAVDLGVSVSRVGGKAQARAFRNIAGNLRVTLSQFEELEDFARFGTRLDAQTEARLARGAAVRAVLRQPERQPLNAVTQLAILTAATEGCFDGLPETLIVRSMERLIVALEQAPVEEISTRIAKNETLTDADRRLFLELAAAARGDHDADA